MGDAKIFLVDTTEQLTPMPATDYINEDQLQRYLERYPDLLAGDQIDPESPRRWLLVAREMGIPAEEDGGNNWSIDHLFIDQDGVPTFVECKRASDTRTRREVVAQMLDYAANGTAYWTMERIRQTATTTASSLDREIDDLVGDLVDGDDELSVEKFWQNVEENLNEGHVRLLFVVDDAPRELRRLVEFLNEKMDDVQVLIVELKQYTGAGQTALVPRVLGQSQKAADRKTVSGAPRKILTRKEFLGQCSAKGSEICQRLWALAEEREYEIVPRSTALALRVKRLNNNNYMTILYTYIGGRPGEETVSYHLDHTMRKNLQALAWNQRLLDSGLFEKRGQWSLFSKPLDDVDAATMVQLCTELLTDGPLLTLAQEDDDLPAGEGNYDE